MNEWVNEWTDRIRILTNNRRGTSLVVQWIRIHLLIQGTQVWSLVWEESMCRRATKPVHQDFWTCVPRARAPQQEKRPQWEAWTRPRGVAPVSPQPEKARTQPPRPAATKNKYIKKKRTEDTLWFWGKIIHEGACEVWGLLEKHIEWYRNPGRRTDVVTPVGCRRRQELGYRNWEGTRFTSPRLLLSLLGSQGREPVCLHQAAHLKVFITHSRGPGSFQTLREEGCHRYVAEETG